MRAPAGGDQGANRRRCWFRCRNLTRCVSGPVSGRRWEEGAWHGLRLAAGDSYGLAIWSPPLAPHSVCVPVPGEAGHVGSPPELRSHAPPDVTGAPTATGPHPLQSWAPPAGPRPTPESGLQLHKGSQRNDGLGLASGLKGERPSAQCRAWEPQRVGLCL